MTLRKVDAFEKVMTKMTVILLITNVHWDNWKDELHIGRSSLPQGDSESRVSNDFSDNCDSNNESSDSSGSIVSELSFYKFNLR